MATAANWGPATANGTATYSGTTYAKTLGPWTNAMAVVVTGGTLKVEHPVAFGRQTCLSVGPSGTLDLDYNGVMRVFEFDLLDNAGVPVQKSISGTWGAIGSGVSHETSLITGTGLVMPMGDGQGTTIIFR